MNRKSKKENYERAKGYIAEGMTQHVPEYFDGTPLGFSLALRKSLLEKGVKDVG